MKIVGDVLPQRYVMLKLHSLQSLPRNGGLPNTKEDPARWADPRRVKKETSLRWPGLEPGVAGYEPAVLSLHYPAILLAALAWGRTGDVAHTLPHYI